jgi:hypothetical protein
MPVGYLRHSEGKSIVGSSRDCVLVLRVLLQMSSFIGGISLRVGERYLKPRHANVLPEHKVAGLIPRLEIIAAADKFLHRWRGD